jgi:hypothetical protein
MIQQLRVWTSTNTVLSTFVFILKYTLINVYMPKVMYLRSTSLYLIKCFPNKADQLPDFAYCSVHPSLCIYLLPEQGLLIPAAYLWRPSTDIRTPYPVQPFEPLANLISALTGFSIKKGPALSFYCTFISAEKFQFL